MCSAFGATELIGANSNNVTQYTGRENDGDGLYYYRARYYDTQIGQFVSRDPLGFGGGDINLYRYTGNNPISYIDPNGLDKTSGGSWGGGSPNGNGPGGSGGGGAPNNGQQQTHKQCADAAQKKLADTENQAYAKSATDFVKSVDEGAVSGLVIGCVLTSEGGCIEGAIPGALTGFLGGAIESGAVGIYHNFTATMQAVSVFNQDVEECPE